MVVEDEKVANELLSSTFKNFFSDVKSCFNGKEALEAYKKSAPDVVFVDIIMSEMDGIELSRKIREIDPGPQGVHLISEACVAVQPPGVEKKLHGLADRMLGQDPGHFEQDGGPRGLLGPGAQVRNQGKGIIRGCQEDGPP